MPHAASRTAALVAGTAVALTGLLAFPLSASAATTYTVTTGVDSADPGSFRWALGQAAAGDTIDFDPAVTAVTLDSLATINTGVIVDGPGHALLTISRSSATGYSLLRANGTAQLSGVTLDGTTGTGTLLVVPPSTGGPTVDDVAFVSADSTIGSGIFANGGTGTLTVTNSSFTGGRATESVGGAIYLDGSRSLSISGSVFHDNGSEQKGGAIHVDGKAAAVTAVTITDSEFSDNSCTEWGGGLFVTSAASVTLTDLDAHGNYCSIGGFFFADTTATVSVDGGTYTANSSSINGGAVSIGGAVGASTVSGATFSGNWSSSGGAVAVAGDGSGTIEDSTCVFNPAGTGGAVTALGVSGQFTIERTSFYSNYAYAGGALNLDAVVSGGDGVSISGSTFAGNFFEEDSEGEGASLSVINLGDSVAISNSTFDEPSSDDGSYVVHVANVEPDSEAELNISGSTFVGPGVLRYEEEGGVAPTLVLNSIFASTGPAAIDAVDSTEDYLWAEYSLFSGPAATNLDDHGGNQFNVADFGLATLANNGGPTPTRMPRYTSPAYGAGDPTSAGGTDQRGHPRVVGRMDIGAVEFDAPFFADVTTPSSAFFEYIQWMYASGASAGTAQPSGPPLYNPANAVSRQAMAAFLYRLANDSFTPPAEPTFADVATDSPFYTQVEWMAAEGISTGTPQPSGKPLFNPLAAVSRQSMALFLARYSDVPNLEVAPATQTFADVPVSASTAAAIEWMYEAGISTGTPQPSGLPLYKPVDPVSRQAMAAFLYRLAHTQAP